MTSIADAVGFALASSACCSTCGTCPACGHRAEGSVAEIGHYPECELADALTLEIVSNDYSTWNPALDAAAAELIRQAGRPELAWWEHLTEVERSAWRDIARATINAYLEADRGA